VKLVHDATVKAEPLDPIAAALAAEPAHLLIDLSECLRLVGGSAANGDNNDPLVLRGDAELKFRQLIAMFGFDRLPFTNGEAHGLLDYCELLDMGSGIGAVAPADLAPWQDSFVKVFSRKRPELVPALKLLCKGDLGALRAFHTAEDTLTRLGREYREYSDGE
jgi:hypothetical protein